MTDNERTETPYTETEALIAVMNGDAGRADALLDDMLPGELRELAGHASELRIRAMTAHDRQARAARERGLS